MELFTMQEAKNHAPFSQISFEGTTVGSIGTVPH
jgi:hypothetical protein